MQTKDYCDNVHKIQPLLYHVRCTTRTVGSSVQRASSGTVWSNLFIKFVSKRYRMVVACLPRCCMRGSIGAPRVLLPSVEITRWVANHQNTTSRKSLFCHRVQARTGKRNHDHGVQSLTCRSNVIQTWCHLPF